MAYSTDVNEGPRQAGFQVAKITRGAKPGDLPIEQAKKFTQSLLKGDPNEVGIIKQSVKAMVEKFVPHSS